VQQPAIDGRTRRAQHTRSRIVDATLSLVDDGDLRPTAPRIAARAGVSVRSVFQHFDDLETLHAAMFDRMLDGVVHLLVPVDVEMPTVERIGRFVAQRAQLLEAVTPLRRAADVYGQSSAVITERLAESHCYLRAEVETAFAPELDSSGAYRAELLDALDAALSWPVWWVLRSDQDLDHDAAVAVVRRTVTALLRATSARR
jgi:TetR/AcrR family transcriptional regulator of autoinduction and epiphytic fitness